MIIITHNLGVVARYADRVNVMYAGQIVETARARELYAEPAPPLHAGPAALGAAPGRDAQGEAGADRGAAARPGAPAAGLPLLPALRLPRRPLPGRVAAAHAASAKNTRRLLGDADARRRATGRAVADGRRRRRKAGELTRRPAPMPEPPDRGDILVDVQDLKMHFPVTAGIIFQRKVARRQAVDGVNFDVKQRRDARPRRRIRLRQVHHGPRHPPALQAHRRRGQLRRHRPDQAQAATLRKHAPQDADDLPGPLRLAEPAHDGRQHHRRAAARSTAWQRQGAQGARPGAAAASSASTPTTPTATRTSSPAASASASASPARWRSSRTSSSPTSRSPRSTCRSRRRSSTCWRTCRTQFNLTYLFIAHDLSVVRHISDRVAVMYLGKIDGAGRPRRALREPAAPLHEGAALRRARSPTRRSRRKRERIILTGDVPSPLRPPPGCVFHTRCPIAIDECRQVDPGVARRRRRPLGGLPPRLARAAPARFAGNRVPCARRSPHARAPICDIRSTPGGHYISMPDHCHSALWIGSVGPDAQLASWLTMMLSK